MIQAMNYILIILAISLTLYFLYGYIIKQIKPDIIKLIKK